MHNFNAERQGLIFITTAGYAASKTTSKNRITTALGYYDEQFSGKQKGKQTDNQRASKRATDNNKTNKQNNIVGQAPTTHFEK